MFRIDNMIEWDMNETNVQFPREPSMSIYGQLHKQLCATDKER